ncbi:MULTISPECIES: hypothetical protein [unclassified Rhizobium]|uniref:hypothetical protein n=1 Tax=unclassified Rhizobium TaxID=2613769 RepID=UPI001FDEA34F|nr:MULTISPECIES: hypothetical protein [unclassified Rhizobium]MDF0662149.1 hypothetical protein [Rhizobium sp. BC49]
MTFIGKQDLLDIGERVAARAGTNPPPVYDIRIDAEALRGNEDPSLRRFVQHQALMRSYQGRYVLLPSIAFRLDPVAAPEALRCPRDAASRRIARKP